MGVTLVDHPDKVPMDPDRHPWDVRLKYSTVAEYLSDYRASNADLGRTHCPATDYLAAHLDDDVLEVETYIWSHPDWGAPVLCESMFRTLLFNHARSAPHGAFMARMVQHYLALNLVRYHSYAAARGPVEAMLKDPRMVFVSPAAAYVVLAYVNAGHPNPGRFLAKPEVHAKFPGLDITRFPAPDFA